MRLDFAYRATEEASKRFFALFFKLLSSLTLSKTREEFAKKQKNCFFFFRPVLQKLDGLRLWPARHRPMLYARQQDSPMAHMISSSTANEGVGNTVFENQRKCLIFSKAERGRPKADRASEAFLIFFVILAKL